MLFVEAARCLLRRTPVLGLSLSTRAGVRRRFHTRLGRSLCAGSRVDHLRSDEPQHRWAQLDSGRGGPRNLAGDVRFRKFHWPLRRLSPALGRSQRKASLIALDKASALRPPDISRVAALDISHFDFGLLVRWTALSHSIRIFALGMARPSPNVIAFRADRRR